MCTSGLRKEYDMMEKSGKYKLMLVDDEPWALIGLRECIDWGKAGFYIVAECNCGEEALRKAAEKSPDAVITDIRMPDMTGLDLIRKLKAAYPGIAAAVVSAYSDFDLMREAMRLSTIDYILKPLSEKNVYAAADALYQKLEAEKGQPVSRFHELSLSALPAEIQVVWLLLSDKQLPADCLEKGAWFIPVDIGAGVGILTNSFPQNTPEGCGVSIAVLRDGDPQELLKTAKCSLNGHFCYPRAAGLEYSSTMVATIQVFLYQHISENLSLRALSERYYLSETYLCDMFKQETGNTIFGFLKQIRMHTAGRMLLGTKRSIQEISEACGYNDPSYFGRHFKQYYGLTPESFRKHNNRILSSTAST